MTSNEWGRELKLLTTGGTRTFVYQFGRGVGFCADYIWLLTCLIKCLEFGYGFRLGKLRTPSGFAAVQGWNDYFEPFFEEADGPFLQVLNRPQLPFAKRAPFLRQIVLPWLRATVRPRADLFMPDALGELTRIRNPRLPSHDFARLCTDILGVLWAFNRETQVEIADRMKRVHLPDQYAAVHIRRGDKRTEHEYVSTDAYAAAIKAADLPADWPIFVASDDKAAIAELAAHLGERRVIFFSESGDGYDQRQFNSMSAAGRRRETVYFLAEFEVMRQSTVFFGSSTTNVASLIGFHRGGDGILWV